MLIVGYGIEAGVQYIIFRNSASEDWGQKGYGKLKFGDCASRMYDYYRPILKPDNWTCPSNRKDICDCDCGTYDPDCDVFYNFTTAKDERYPSTCSQGTMCSPLTLKCEKWTCDPMEYNAGYFCNCNCGSWDPDCEKHESYATIEGCNMTNKEICSRVDGSCVAGWTCNMKDYGVPGKCHCGCGIYDPGCSNCSAELINCAQRPECKEESSSEQKIEASSIHKPEASEESSESGGSTKISSIHKSETGKESSGSEGSTKTSSIHKSETGKESSESGGSDKPGHRDEAMSLAGFGFMAFLIAILLM